MSTISNCIAKNEMILNNDFCVQNENSFNDKSVNMENINPFEIDAQAYSPLSGKLLMCVSDVFGEDLSIAKFSLKNMLTQLGS